LILGHPANVAVSHAGVHLVSALRCVPMDPPITEISDGDTTWRFDRSFLTSNGTCIWGRGCLGILPNR
jgi:hypothetical protein